MRTDHEISLQEKDDREGSILPDFAFKPFQKKHFTWDSKVVWMSYKFEGRDVKVKFCTTEDSLFSIMICKNLNRKQDELEREHSDELRAI